MFKIITKLLASCLVVYMLTSCVSSHPNGNANNAKPEEIFTYSFKKVSTTRDGIENYLESSSLDPIEGVWSGSMAIFTEWTANGKTQSVAKSGVDTDEYYIVRNHLSGSEEYMLIYNRELSPEGAGDIFNFGDIIAIAIKDIYDPHKYYFSFDSGRKDTPATIFKMHLNDNLLKGSYSSVAENGGVKLSTKQDRLFKRVSIDRL
ncbi:MAG: hypothetical protein Q8M98_00545 [Candidatus Cloacimonadaceae bacterium]|nr:hypothetical protein [Candidatus Cloacimonadaceae bacterium]